MSPADLPALNAALNAAAGLLAAYFAILISHTVLAAAIVPLAAVTLMRALRGRFKRHAAIARWTLPIWMYVSVTGVVIHFRLYGTPRHP